MATHALLLMMPGAVTRCDIRLTCSAVDEYVYRLQLLHHLGNHILARSCAAHVARDVSRQPAAVSDCRSGFSDDVFAPADENNVGAQ